MSLFFIVHDSILFGQDLYNEEGFGPIWKSSPRGQRREEDRGSQGAGLPSSSLLLCGFGQVTALGDRVAYF